VSEVTVVTVTGDGSMDVYGRELACRIGAPELRAEVSRVFGARLNAGGLLPDLRFAATVRAHGGVLHFTGHHLARYAPAARLPYVVTVHDLIRHLDAWGDDPLVERPTRRDRLLLALDRRGIRGAGACIAVSQHTRRALIRHLGVPAERIFVVYEGIDHDRFRPTGPRPVDGPYVLFVGSEHPRKNLAGLLRAFATLKRDHRFRALKLVKVGSPGNPPERFRGRTLALVKALGLEADVVFTGRVGDAELPRYYSAAACLVLPSRHEGFGLPPLEAMACGCPVVVSSATALPEITGDAALAVDPCDVGALARALEALIGDPALARRMTERGTRHAATFTWERTTRRTEEVYAFVESAAAVRRRAQVDRGRLPAWRLSPARTPRA
jgi:glycosyltransferase involved in cell wall biosynthesis